MIFKNSDYIIVCNFEEENGSLIGYTFSISDTKDLKEKFRFYLNKKYLKKFAEFLNWIVKNK